MRSILLAGLAANAAAQPMTDFQLSDLRKRETNYVQDYTTGGDVEFSHSSGSFYVNFDTTDDFVVGVGWNPGSTVCVEVS